MRTTVLMLIVCMGCAGSASAGNWEITEIPVPVAHSHDHIDSWTIDDYGHLYWVHYFYDCDANGQNCDPSTYTLYRYDWATDSVSTIAQPPQETSLHLGDRGGIPTFVGSDGINVAWVRDNDNGRDIFFYDGDEVTNITNTADISEYLLGVSGDSVYYLIYDEAPDYRYRLFHAVKWESATLDCNTVRSFGYKLDSDLSGDCYVSFRDLSVFAQEWLECNNPSDPNCTHPW